MPWRLYRYMLLDMLRQFAITAAVLVVVIAFGAAIKPLSNDSLLSPWDAARFVGFAMIPMLQFAIPFAAAFAVTLTFHRLSQDNEIIAMAVAGQSYSRILAPFAVLGLTLTLVLGGLTQWVIPSFIGKMTESLAADMPRMLTRSIQQHTPFVQGNLVIWAEKVFLGGEDGSRIVLEHAAVAKVDRMNLPTMYLTSTATSIDIDRESPDNSLLIRSRNTVQWTDDGEGAGSTRGARESELTHAIEINSETHQRPAAMTIGELQQAKGNPALYPPIEKTMNRLRDLLVLDEFWQTLSKIFNITKGLIFPSLINDQQIVIRANSISGDTFRGGIEVDLHRRNGETTLLVPKSARLQAEQDEHGSVTSLSLHMKKVLVGVGEIGENTRSELSIQDLHVDPDSAITTIEDDVQELLARAQEFNKGAIPRTAARLLLQIEDLDRQSVSRINQRWAMSASALLIVLLGGVTAIRLRDKSALNAFSRVFFPSVFAIILVFAGGQIVRDGRVAFGFSIMWVGNASVAGLILISWLRLRAH